MEIYYFRAYYTIELKNETFILYHRMQYKIEDSMEDIKKEFEDAKDRLNHKFQEIKYSSEYLNLKADAKNMATHTKQVVVEDMSGIAKNVGKIVKKFLSNEKFTQLITAKK